jgi:ribose transport system ATP-binding protein
MPAAPLAAGRFTRRPIGCPAWRGATAMSDEIVLKITDVSKSFGAIRALRGVDFELRRGEVHAIAGENGAGKSTLMNIIDGILRPDSGEIVLNGEPVEIGSPARAQELGIGFVHQEIALCPDVTVAENIFMAEINASRKWFMNYPDLYARAREALAQLSPIDPTVLVKSLSISQQQLVEIAKALTLDCRILILDEPTAALTERETRVLFGIMRKLAARGISIIYISHRLVEIFENCDRVSIFRDGRRVATAEVAAITPDYIVTNMVGRVIGTLYPPKQSEAEQLPGALMEVRGLTDGRRFRNVTFELRRGEILGIAGLIGAGRSEIVKGICGLHEGTSGEVFLDGKPFPLRTYRDSIDNGVVYLSEDRKGDGVFLDLSIAANVAAIDLRQVSTPWGTIDTEKEADQANRLGDRLGLKRGSIDDPVSSLSGGNQQKVAIAKMLSVNPRVIFLDEPTRGVDVGAKAEIHRILRDLARDGVGIVAVSSELPELIGLCDRVLVVREGEISGTVEGDALTEENIMRLASFTARAEAASTGRTPEALH